MRSASGARDAAPGVFKAARQPIDPQTPIGIQHHFDDAGVFEVAGDRRPERRAQHARAAGESFGSQRDRRHVEPREVASSGGGDVSGVD